MEAFLLSPVTHIITTECEFLIYTAPKKGTVPLKLGSTPGIHMDDAPNSPSQTTRTIRWRQLHHELLARVTAMVSFFCLSLFR